VRTETGTAGPSGANFLPRHTGLFQALESSTAKQDRVAFKVRIRAAQKIKLLNCWINLSCGDIAKKEAIEMLSECVSDPAATADGRGRAGEAALQLDYPGMKLVHEWRPDVGVYYRYAVQAIRLEEFYLEFTAMEVTAIGRSDEAWATAFVSRVRRAPLL
jgi:hypothetical protein